MRDTSNMPARIWAGGDIPLRHWSEHKPRHRDDPIDTAYIRADIVEAMAGALDKAEHLYSIGLLNAPDGLANEVAALRRTALNSYREASNG